MSATDQKFYKNFASLVFSNFFVQGLRFLTVILLGRNLNQDQFGIYNYILLLVGLCAILVEFGLKNYGIREFAQGRGNWNLTKKIISIRLVVSLIGVLIATGFCFQAFRNINLILPTLIFSFSLVVDAFLVDFVSIADERLHLQAIAQTLQAAVFLGCVYVVMQLKWGLIPIAIAFTFSHIFWVAIYVLKTRKLFVAGPSVTMTSVVKSGLPFLIASFLATMAFQLDIFLLGQFHYDFLLGDYSACLKLLAIPLGIVGSFLSSVQPKLARVSHEKLKLRALLLHYVGYLLIFISLMCITCWFFGPDIIRLFFGLKFAVAPFYIGPLSLVTGVFILTLLPLYALSVSTDTKTLVRISFVNFVLGAIVISSILSMKRPEWLPWGMLLVQSVCAVQTWRHYLKK